MLKTNYTNSILDTAINDKTRYAQTVNADGTYSFDNVSVYKQKGDTFGANDINETNEVVNNLVDCREIKLKANSWVNGTGGVYYQDANFENITAEDSPIIMLGQPLEYSLDGYKQARRNFSRILRALSSNGKIRFMCYVKPAIDLNILVKGV